MVRMAKFNSKFQKKNVPIYDSIPNEKTFAQQHFALPSPHISSYKNCNETPPVCNKFRPKQVAACVDKNGKDVWTGNAEADGKSTAARVHIARHSM